jgi:Family of unknown function (DUF5939)
MAEADRRFQALVELGVPASIAGAMQRFVAEAEPHELGRINVLDFAARYAEGEDGAIGAFVRAARIGLFDIAWDLLCPRCGGILGSGATLKTFDKPDYACALCAARYDATLDEMVEVSFCVSPSVRAIPAHDPDTLSP